MKMVKSKNMLMYITKRILVMIIMVFFVLVATFFLTHLMQVNPALNKMSSDPRVPYSIYLFFKVIGGLPTLLLMGYP